jgi:hypothetical protein
MNLEELFLDLASAGTPDEATSVGVRALESGHRARKVECLTHVRMVGHPVTFLAMVAHVRRHLVDEECAVVHTPASFRAVP